MPRTLLYQAFPELPVRSGQTGPFHSPAARTELSRLSTGPFRGLEEMENQTTKAAAVKPSVPKECPQSWPWGVE